MHGTDNIVRQIKAVIAYSSHMHVSGLDPMLHPVYQRTQQLEMGYCYSRISSPIFLFEHLSRALVTQTEKMTQSMGLLQLPIPTIFTLLTLQERKRSMGQRSHISSRSSKEFLRYLREIQLGRILTGHLRNLRALLPNVIGQNPADVNSSDHPSYISSSHISHPESVLEQRILD